MVDEIIKAVQSVIAPELKALQERVEANHREIILRLDSINQRFDDLLERLDLDRRLTAIERERDERKAS